ncbi:MAG: C39 family peptidase [Opitutales bacterium]|nr:C39 family peptidase [Opitutales bacterium]MCH8539712.1 C39 family peptidase [Opitutales bacterium]
MLLRTFLLLFSGSLGLSLQGSGFYLTEKPDRWRFSEPTPAYETASKTEEMGTFQPGIEVQVKEVLPEDKAWRVHFARAGQEPLESFVDIPSLKKIDSRAVADSAEIFAEFPLLEKLMELDYRLLHGDIRDLAKALAERDKWGVTAGSRDDPTELTLRTSEITPVFGHEPVQLQLQKSIRGGNRIVVDVWNKGFTYQRPDFRENSARSQIRRGLNSFLEIWQNHGASHQRVRGGELTMIRDGGEVYSLPNFINLTFRHESGEYMILEITSAVPRRDAQGPPSDPAELRAFLEKQVTTSEETGHRYIENIPMINQGSRGYCVVATMGRVLNFYGFEVEINSLANLAGTLPETAFGQGGTFLNDALRAMRQSSHNSPFRLTDISAQSRRAERNVREAIEAGTPILWLIPGHMNLIIGYHPEGEGIVYSDSWGPGHEFKTMSWDKFHHYNQGMYLLRP